MDLHSPRYFYIGMVNLPSYMHQRSLSLYSGAASLKMSSIARALASVGGRVFLVTIPTLNREAPRVYERPWIGRQDAFPVLCLATFSNRWIRKFYAFFALIFFVIGSVRRQDKVIFYNHAFEYLGAALALKIMGKASFQDIEDCLLKEIIRSGI